MDRRALSLLLLGWLGGCLSAETRRDYEALARVAEEPPAFVAPAPASGAAEAEVEAGLARETRLESVLALVVARSPAVREARARLRSELAQVPAAARLPDLALQYEQWGVPLARPYAVHEAEMLMLGLRQTFPPGLDERARAALEDARVLQANVAARVSLVVAQARKAYAEFYRADRELAIHRTHLELTERLVEVARAAWSAGSGSQQQILALLLDSSRFHATMAATEAERASAAALLNALMLREPTAPLGPAGELAAALPELDRAALDALAVERRPELEAARSAVARSEAALEVARSEARWPELMVGVDYMLDPEMGMHFYGAMVSVTLPWLNPRHGETIASAEHAVEAERAALEGTRAAARFEVQDAAARYTAARTVLGILAEETIPRAEQSFDAARAEFLGGRGDAGRVLDAVRALWDVRLERVRTLARLHTALADVDRAVGRAGGGGDPP